MDQKVEISRSALAGLLFALVACLMTVAFMLGRQTATPPVAATLAPPVALVAALTPGPMTAEKTSQAIIVSHAVPTRREPVTVDRPLPAAAPAEIAAPQRDPAPPVRVQAASEGAVSYPQGRSAAGSKTAPAPVPKPKPAVSAPQPESAKAPKAASGDQEAVRRYLAQVDQVMAGTQSVGDANAFATELLQQSLQGDRSGFDQLLETSRAALRDLQAIKPPPSCKEHHTLIVRQVKDGIGLLSKVGSATSSMDTTSLSSLALQGKDMQSDIARFQELDRQLRSGVR